MIPPEVHAASELSMVKVGKDYWVRVAPYVAGKGFRTKVIEGSMGTLTVHKVRSEVLACHFRIKPGAQVIDGPYFVIAVADKPYKYELLSNKYDDKHIRLSCDTDGYTAFVVRNPELVSIRDRHGA